MRAVLVCLLAALAVSANVPKPFKGQQSYVYRFDTQVSSSLVGSTAAEIQQQAATRLRADVHIDFTSESHANLQMQHVRIGELNAELPKPQRVQPLEHFERIEIPSDLKKKLEMPFSVKLVDGVVDKVHFSEGDFHWSQNIKKAVLNMITLNLQKSAVNGKLPRTLTEQEKNSPVFTIPEFTLEGLCESVYTVQTERAGQQQERESNFNVTKTIDFARCTKTPVVSFGYAPKASQEMRCYQCLRTQSTQQQQQSAQQQEQIRNTHCQQECTPMKVNADNDVERSTFARYELQGTTERYAIKRVSMLSNYIVKGQNPAAENAVMQVVSLSELTFKEQSENKKQLVQQFKQTDAEHDIVYEPTFDLEEKRFYMTGDEEFSNRSPFAVVPNKEAKAAHSMKQILKQWAKRQQGYEPQSTHEFNRLVQLMRESSVQELRKIEDIITSGSQQQGDEQKAWCESTDAEKCEQHARELFIDALAVAATRNTLYVLAQKIIKNEMSTVKAAATLQLFASNQHSPSEQQVEILRKIAQHEVAHRSGPLKQTAYLAWGAAIGQLCQPQPMQQLNAYFRVEDLCSRGKRESWKQQLVQLWADANTQYEQILALKAIGNAALDVAMPELEKIVVDKRQPTIVRIEAIDALRRLRTTQSQQIRQMLMPVFLNQRERPEVRMAALSMIMYTQPERALLDQVAYQLLAERSQNVKTFVFTALKALSQSPVSAEREVAEHLKSQLKAIEISEEEMRASRVIRAPIFVSDRETSDEQTIFLALATIVSPSSMIPARISASIRSAFNGQATEESVKLSFTQQNLDKFYSQMSDMYNDYQNEDEEGKDKLERRGAKDLRSIYSSLGLKSRRNTNSYYAESNEEDEEEQQQQQQQQQDNKQQQQQSGRRTSDARKPFAMIVLRAADIDMAIVPMSEEQLPQVIRKMLVEQTKPSMEELESLTRMIPSGRVTKHAAFMLNEKKTKIPTTSGLPLALIRQITGVGSIEGQFKTEMSSSDLGSRGLQAHLKMHTSGVVTHMLESVVWTPILSTGIKTLRSAEMNLPVELKIRADRTQLEIKAMPMRGEDKTRVFGMHVLPIAYTRKTDPQTQNKREAQIKTIHNMALEHAQREFRTHEQQDRALIVEGTYHQLSSAKQMLNALYNAEANIHVYLSQSAPKELRLRLSGSAFEKHSSHGKPEFDQFYDSQSSSSKKGFSSIFEEDDERMQSERDEDRRSSLSKYNNQYNGQQAYKHQLKIEAEAHYEQGQTAKAVVELKGACDSRLKHCKVFVDAERSPMRWLKESQPWKFNAKVQTIAPELIRDEEEPSTKQARMLIKSEMTWGSEEKNELNLRLQAEPTKKQMWSGNDERTESQDKWSRFLNKLDIIAEARLRPYAKHMLQAVYNAARANLWWQSTTEPRRGEENTFRATIVVDPMTRQYANISVQTPQERVRAEGVEVPATVLALTSIKLNRRPQQYHNMQSLVNEYTGFERAQCKANERRVKTFDGVSYRAPMSECWTVLAKDCSSESKFAVLMKKDDEQMRVKIITQDSTIELQRKSDNERVQVKIDGEQVKDESRLQEEGIQLNYDTAYVQKRQLDVVFDGEEVKVQLGQQYKNKQCGLCAHYDDEGDDNEFRNADGQQSRSLSEFHKSFTLKNEECDNSRLNKFYEQNEDKFDRDSEHKREQSRRRYGSGNRRSSWFDSQEESQEERQNEKRGEGWMNSNSDEEQTDMKNIKPVKQTQVMEYNHRICFSNEPVLRCPRGSSPAEDEKTQSKKVAFWCVERTEGRKLQRQVRHGEQIDNEGRQPAFVDTIEQPTKCVAY